MAFPYNYIKLTFGGVLANTEEIWTCGFHIAKQDSDVNISNLPSEEGTKATEIVNALKEFHSSSDNRVPTNMRLNWVKFALIGKNGKYIGAPTEIILDPFQSGASSYGFIPSTAVVYTLVANKFKDPGKYNRFYLPTIPPKNIESFKETSTQGLDRANSLKTLIQAVNAAFAADAGAVAVRVISQRTTAYSAVDSIRVGDVIDVQRRRRNRLYETYQEVTI